MRIQTQTAAALAALVTLPWFLMGCAQTTTAGDSSASELPVVLVIGATGRTGGPILAALGDDYRIRALVRDLDRARAQLPATVTLFRGDVRQPETLASAFEGTQFVVSAVGARFVGQGELDDPMNTPELVDYEGVKHLAGAARTAGVKHFVLVSAMGVTRSGGSHDRMANIMHWKLKGENALRTSGVPYTIVRPGGLTDEAGGTFGTLVAQGDNQGPGQTNRIDVARICVRALTDPAARNVTLEVVKDASQPVVPSDGDVFSGLKADVP
ncbi:MAG: SDR family oxidoreductase [Chromatiales bacterium]|nr:MAG: SDR family oxidoreductase [Chromatiales bacterium]